MDAHDFNRERMSLIDILNDLEKEGKLKENPTIV